MCPPGPPQRLHVVNNIKPIRHAAQFKGNVCHVGVLVKNEKIPTSLIKFLFSILFYDPLVVRLYH
jgi:hypothetical protein